VSEVIEKLQMPKWGMSMTEGRLIEWLVPEGAVLAVGDEVAEVETEKINGVIEAPATGVLRRRVASPGDTVPVGGLVGVLADASVSDAEVDAFIERFRATFVPEEEEVVGPEPEVIDLSGKRIRYLQHGDGDDVVVLVHGFGGDLEGWLFNQGALATGRTVYALDLPGHGGSVKDVGAGDLEVFAAAIAEFLDARGHRRAHLVGHSLGGAVSIVFALARPERAVSLTLIASAGLGPEINGDYIEGFVRATGRRELKPVLELLFADPSLVTRQLVDNVLRNKRVDGADDALRTIAAKAFPVGNQAAVLAPQLVDLNVPLLVIWGSEDRIIPVRHADAVAATARVEVIPDTGHSPHMEAAGVVNRLIDEFLSAASA